MKSFVKVTLLVAAIASSLSAPLAFAAPAADASNKVTLNKAFKTEDQQVAYALGASFGRLMAHSLEAQSKMGVSLDKKVLLQGLGDSLDSKSKLSDAEIASTLEAFDSRMKQVAQQEMEKTAKENGTKGDEFQANFAKQQGVKKTDSGLLYKVEKEGSGESPKPGDTVVVNYTGSLIDGTEFDSSYKRHEPLSFRLDSVIPGWTEGLQLIKKGGKIKLVIPPNLAYGEMGVPGIPPNSTLVFDVELLDIKPAAASSAPDSATGQSAADKGADKK